MGQRRPVTLGHCVAALPASAADTDTKRSVWASQRAVELRSQGWTCNAIAGYANRGSLYAAVREPLRAIGSVLPPP